MSILKLYSLYFIVFVKPSVGWFWCEPDCRILRKSEILSGLNQNLSSSLFGQHLVRGSVLAALDSHLDGHSDKALVLSFHGPPGVGKNFVANKIAHHMFEKGADSAAYVFYSGSHDFQTPHKLRDYHILLKEKIRNTVKKCEWAVFVFDEADKMLDGIFSVLKPYMDHTNKYDGIDYRRTTFIFLSNIGFKEITRVCYKHSKVKGREKLQLKDFHDTLMAEALNEKGGLQYTNIITSHLVDHFVPFLPLEKVHVEKCIETAALKRYMKVDEKLKESVFGEIPFQGPDEDYAPAGCKRVDALVSLYKSNIYFRTEL